MAKKSPAKEEGAVATAEPPKKTKGKKAEAPPSMPKKKDEPKPLTPKERIKKMQQGQSLVDTLEHRLTGAKAHVKEIASQLDQAKKKLREDVLDVPQGEFGFQDGADADS